MAEAPPSPDSEPTAGDAPAILVVDDEPGVVGVIATMLSRRGMTVRTAHSAAAAKQALADDPEIGVVLSDIHMPEQDGLALAEEILADRPEAQALEVVFVTSDIAPETMGSALRQRAFDFVAKPFRLSELAAVVARARASCRDRRARAARLAAMEAGLTEARDDRLRLAERLALSMAARAEAEAALGAAQHDRHNLLAVISHELRTPLIPILGLCDLILSEPAMPRERLVDYVAHIRDGGLRLRDLVQGALDVIALEDPAALRKATGVPLSPVIEAAAARTAPVAEARGVALLAGALPSGTVAVDATLLSHAVAALLDNAVKASDTGGTVVYGWAAEGAAPDAMAVIWVDDDGPGIGPEVIDKIGTPFLQGDMSATRGWRGAGLGLAVASRIVARHGGILSLERRHGGGTRASIGLPMEPPAA